MRWIIKIEIVWLVQIVQKRNSTSTAHHCGQQQLWNKTKCQNKYEININKKSIIEWNLNRILNVVCEWQNKSWILISRILDSTDRISSVHAKVNTMKTMTIMVMIITYMIMHNMHFIYVSKVDRSNTTPRNKSKKFHWFVGWGVGGLYLIKVKCEFSLDMD